MFKYHFILAILFISSLKYIYTGFIHISKDSIFKISSITQYIFNNDAIVNDINTNQNRYIFESTCYYVDIRSHLRQIKSN